MPYNKHCVALCRSSTRAALAAPLVKNPPAVQETWVPSLGWEDSPGERKGCPLQYSGLENSVHYMVRGVAKSRRRLSNFHVRCRESATGVTNHVPSVRNLPPISHPAPPCRWSQSPGLSSPSHRENPQLLSILHLVENIFLCSCVHSPSPITSVSLFSMPAFPLLPCK